MYNLAVSIVWRNYDKGVVGSKEFKKDVFYLTDWEKLGSEERAEIVANIKKDGELLKTYSQDLRGVYDLRVHFRLFAEVVDDKEILQREVNDVWGQGKDALVPRITSSQGTIKKDDVKKSICGGVDKLWNSRVVVKPEAAPTLSEYAKIDEKTQKADKDVLKSVKSLIDSNMGF